MAPRPTTNGTATSPILDKSAAGPVPPSPVITTQEPVVVNNANLTELKLACDDALKRFLSRPDSFKTNHTHTDVRLALGWAGVFVAAGTALYGYKIEFEQSKPVVWVGLIVYIILTSVQSLYAYFIEGNVVFQGKRKTFAKRIETEWITVSSKTTSGSGSTPPAYSLSLVYVHSSNGGKSLIKKGKETGERSYTSFFDGNGKLDVERFEEWLGGLVTTTISSK